MAVSQPARIAAFYFAYFCYLGAYAPYFSLYLAGEGFAAGEIAAILALPQFARIFAPMAWGWLSDATGSRRGVVALSSGLTTLAVGLLFFVSGFLPTALAVALVGVCSAAILSIVDALAFSVLAPHTHRYGPVRMWGSVGFIFAVLATGAMLDVLPVRKLLWVLFGLSLASFVIAFQLPAPAVEKAAQVKGSLRAILRRPEVVAFFAACTCMTVAHGALYAFYSLYLVDHGYSKSSRAVRHLFTVVSSFTPSEWSCFVKFVTGASRLPAGGLKSLRPSLTVVRKTQEEGETQTLPSVMTCANYLKLPDYETVERMRERLVLAMREGGDAFHLS